MLTRHVALGTHAALNGYHVKMDTKSGRGQPRSRKLSMSDVNWYGNSTSRRHRPMPDRSKFKGSRDARASKNTENPRTAGAVVAAGDDDDSLESLYEC